MGYTNTYAADATCESWLDAQKSQPVLTDGLFPDKTVADAKNYCRDPLKGGSLVCYSNGTLQKCNVPECQGRCLF